MVWVFAFRAKRAARVKLICWDRTGLCRYSKWLEQGSFRWPRIENGTMRLTSAQLAALIEGLDWDTSTRPRRPSTVCQPVNRDTITHRAARGVQTLVAMSRTRIIASSMVIDSDSLPTDAAELHAIIRAERARLTAVDHRGATAPSLRLPLGAARPRPVGIGP